VVEFSVVVVVTVAMAIVSRITARAVAASVNSVELNMNPKSTRVAQTSRSLAQTSHSGLTQDMTRPPGSHSQIVPLRAVLFRTAALCAKITVSKTSAQIFKSQVPLSEQHSVQQGQLTSGFDPPQSATKLPKDVSVFLSLLWQKPTSKSPSKRLELKSYEPAVVLKECLEKPKKSRQAKIKNVNGGI
jgi:hypothetical protein